MFNIAYMKIITDNNDKIVKVTGIFFNILGKCLLFVWYVLQSEEFGC